MLLNQAEEIQIHHLAWAFLRGVYMFSPCLCGYSGMTQSLIDGCLKNHQGKNDQSPLLPAIPFKIHCGYTVHTFFCVPYNNISTYSKTNVCSNQTT